MKSNSSLSVREASTLTTKPWGILINVGSIALYMACYFTRGSLGTKVEPNIVFARSDGSLRCFWFLFKTHRKVPVINIH